LQSGEDGVIYLDRGLGRFKKEWEIMKVEGGIGK
jgi:hypothetical protein